MAIARPSTKMLRRAPHARAKVMVGEHVGETVVTCGLVVEQRTHHQITGEPMKFLTLADWTGMVKTELFAQTYKSYGLATVRYPLLEVTATVEPFENGRRLFVARAAGGETTSTNGWFTASLNFPPPNHFSTGRRRIQRRPGGCAQGLAGCKDWPSASGGRPQGHHL